MGSEKEGSGESESGDTHQRTELQRRLRDKYGLGVFVLLSLFEFMCNLWMFKSIILLQAHNAHCKSSQIISA